MVKQINSENMVKQGKIEYDETKPLYKDDIDERLINFLGNPQKIRYEGDKMRHETLQKGKIFENLSLY